MNRRTKLMAAGLAMIAGLLMGQVNPDEEFRLILEWKKPDPYPPAWLKGMDVPTLSKLLDAGNLQWYEPRPEPEIWEAVVGLKVHAPPEKVWEVITDYPALCKIMPLTYLSCETEYRDGNKVKNNQKGQTTVLRFAYKYDIIDMVTEDPPYHHHVNTISGLDKRELDVILVPVDDNKNTLMFMRYYLNMAALGLSMQVVLKVMPTVEPPTAAGAANYHSRAYKNEAEARVGYKPLPEPAPLDTSNLDLNTMKLIVERGGGIIRENPQGKLLDAICFRVVDDAPDKVWDVITDFEHYPEIFPGAKCQVESRTDKEVVVMQETSSFSVLIFSFYYQIHARYLLDPPGRIGYRAFDGTYEGSHGEFRLAPIDGGRRTLLFNLAGISLDKDNGLTAQIAKSGAFPLENMLSMMGTQSTLVHIKKEVEKRKAARGGK